MQTTQKIKIDFYQRFIETRSRLANISSKSLVATVFGDVVSQHGGTISLSSLIDAIMPLGFTERLIRTSVFRLAGDDWLGAEKIGRCSYYSMTDSAKLQYAKAARRIYMSERPRWDGQWLLVLPAFVPEQKLPAFKKQIEWLGFNLLANGVYAHPSFEKQSLDETLQEMELSDSVIVLNASAAESVHVLKKLIHTRWNVDEIELQYKGLLKAYQPLQLQIQQGELPDAQQSLLIRILLIHEYRRILLKDNELPESMLPKESSAKISQTLVKSLYQCVAEQSIAYITQHLENEQGLLPSENHEFWNRFATNVRQEK